MKPKAPEPNDDPNFDPEDIAAASEMPAESASAPEVPPKLEGLTEWDRPLDADGHAAPKVAMEDEVNVAEELVSEGVEEADREQRIASVDPDFEP